MNDCDKKIKYLSLSQASKETGKSKSVIFKAIQNGTLSYVEKTTAGYKLDRDEVFLLFHENDFNAPARERSRTITENDKNDLTERENDFLKRENGLLRQQIEQLSSQVNREKENADNWRNQAASLLTHQPEPETQKEDNTKLLFKIFGRRH